MRRRKAVKAIALSTVTPRFLFGRRETLKADQPSSLESPSFESQWHQWPDMSWTGPELWGNRLQDWNVTEGRVIVRPAANRTLHCLTCELSEKPEPFESSVDFAWMEEGSTSENYFGFVLGARGRFNDYRAAAVFGEGLRAGIGADGRLFIGDTRGNESIKGDHHVLLELRATPDAATGDYALRLKAKRGSVVTELVVQGVKPTQLNGNLALISHFEKVSDIPDKPTAVFLDKWMISGPKITVDTRRAFGPICFAQYTLQRNILKLTAQMAPVESIPGHKVALQVRAGNNWKTLAETNVGTRSRTSHFRIESWPYKETTPYRIRLELPLKDSIHEYFYEGSIDGVPWDARQVKMAVFSCNCDHGFPDADVPFHVSKHKPDLAVFLGDQYYESTGGFGVDRDNAYLDYLRKWFMFGWSYRDIFRHIPSITIPDDHDVYHGNVWGEGGKPAPTDKGWGYEAQDRGGYKMPAEWVNIVQECQTSHLPDPYDPKSIQQHIGVYYTAWNYAGISMAILEDRKFKSAPKNVLPPEAKVVNGFIQNPDFDIRKYYDVDAELLGERQITFLNDWAADWKDRTEMKVVLSQTNFCAVATLPKGSILDNMVPQLPIPSPGEYVEGDAPTSDMDSNGWPQKGRDTALKVIRKCFALHIAGDQHLASVVQYGIRDHGDAGFAFAGPALNNLWPRRWWPPVADHKALPGQPRYTGDFEDGFGNKMTVLAVANPRKTHRVPAIIHDRATGYGMVTFDKDRRTITIECWPRHADPEKGSGGQYEGWPITIRQEDNYGRKALGFLPKLRIEGTKDPVIQVVNERSGEVEYTLRIKGNSFQPKVFDDASYTVKVSDPDLEKEKIIKGLKISTVKDHTIEVKVW